MEIIMTVLDMFKLDGKVALVTGGAGNYGRQMTEALAEAGATVWTASRHIDANEKCAAELRERGYSVYADEYDQSSEESIRALLSRMTEKHGRVDILVNNSVLRPFKHYGDPAEVFAESMAVNATGLFMITRAFGDHMAEMGSGSIINIGSYMGDLGLNDTLYEGCPEMSSNGAPDYYFHKGGMHNLTRFMAAYYGPSGVRCNCLSLGGLFNNQKEEFLEQYKKATFLRRMASGTDIKGILVYLASEASAYTTGAVIPVDGGYSAK